MDETYISREALIRELIGKGFYPAIVKQAIAEAPAADVAPVVHAEWKFIDHDETGYEVECTHCGTHFTFPSKAHLTKHCPECGAKMDGGSNGR